MYVVLLASQLSRRKSKPNYLSLNILASNCRSFTAKKKSLEKILADNSIDIAIISELNLTKNTPKIKIISNFAIFQTENATELVSFVRITFKDR